MYQTLQLKKLEMVKLEFKVIQLRAVSKSYF